MMVVEERDRERCTNAGTGPEPLAMLDRAQDGAPPRGGGDLPSPGIWMWSPSSR